MEQTWRDWARGHGIDADAIMAIAHGRQNEEIIRIVAPHLDLPEEYERMIRAEEECLGVVAVAGARELVDALPADRWAVVTSAWRRLAEIRMGLAGLGLPPVVVTSDDITRSKPDPEGYLAAAARLGARPADCIVIEDAPAGLEAGRRAGMRVIGVITNFSRERLDADWYVTDLRGIRPVSGDLLT